MTFKKILLPIDINDKSSWLKTLPTAASMLKSDPDSELWIVSVIPNFGMNMVESYFPAGWTKEIKVKTLKTLEEIIANNLPIDSKVNLIVEKGVVYQAILENAEKLEIDLIIMAAGNDKNKEYLLGPNPARVVRHANISVLIQR
ncbi:MAG: universal stress protein [Pseudomonadota bacterium]